MASPLPTISCKECGYVNEGERVYCHGCGVKLDRNLLIIQEQEQAAHSQKRLREVRRIMTPGRGGYGTKWKKLCKTVALAAVAGLLIDAALPPEGAPGAKKEESSDPSQIDGLLDTLVAAPAGKRVMFREADINAFLKRERFKKVPSWITDAIALRALVQFEDGIGRLTLMGTTLGYPLYLTLSGTLKPDVNAGLTATCTGGNIGRLQIPPQLAQYAGLAIPTVFDSLKRERKLLGQLGSITFQKQQVILSARGSSAPAAALPAANVAPGSTQGRPAVP